MLSRLPPAAPVGEVSTLLHTFTAAVIVVVVFVVVALNDPGTMHEQCLP
jgi:hypothetical protein